MPRQETAHFVHGSLGNTSPRDDRSRPFSLPRLRFPYNPAMPPAILMDGKAVAAEINDATARRVASLKQRGAATPCLAAVLVGDDPASATYVNMKARLCEKLGMTSIKVELPPATTTEELVARLQSLAKNKDVHGILLQHPCPPQVDERVAFETIPGAKDVDGVTFHSFGAMTFGEPGFASCTPSGIMHLLRRYDAPIEGAHAVVVGRSAILGKPMAMLLLAANATVTICHSRTRDLPEIVRQGDIVVAAVGRPEFVKGDWIKPGAFVIDAGYCRTGTDKLVGDVEFEQASAHAHAITPVPGGVGPMTLAVLMDQTARAAARLQKLPEDPDLEDAPDADIEQA